MPDIESGHIWLVYVDEKLFKFVEGYRLLMPGDESGDVAPLAPALGKFAVVSQRHVPQSMLFSAVCRPNKYTDGKIFTGAFLTHEIQRKTYGSNKYTRHKQKK